MVSDVHFFQLHLVRFPQNKLVYFRFERDTFVNNIFYAIFDAQL